MCKDGGKLFVPSWEKSAKTKRVKQRESLQNSNEETRKSQAEEKTKKKKKNN
jgi:hypothetical protein